MCWFDYGERYAIYLLLTKLNTDTAQLFCRESNNYLSTPPNNDLRFFYNAILVTITLLIINMNHQVDCKGSVI